MYPALEWLPIAFFFGTVFSVAAWILFFRRGKLPGDLFLWAVLIPAFIFLGISQMAGEYGNWSGRIIEIVNLCFDWAIGLIGVKLTDILIALLVAALGVGAHHLKMARRKWYGTIEMLIGIFTAFFVAGTLTVRDLELSKWTALAAAAYVIARGLGNWNSTEHKPSARNASGGSTGK